MHRLNLHGLKNDERPHLPVLQGNQHRQMDIQFQLLGSRNNDDSATVQMKEEHERNNKMEEKITLDEYVLIQTAN